MGVGVILCIASDTFLILGGTLGIGVLVDGIVYILWWATRSLMAALKSSSLLTAKAPRSRGSMVATALAVTYLNPHVYLDTVVLLGSLANQHGPDARWVFAAGAIIGSALWFPALGYGAQSLSGRLNRPLTWRAIDLATGLVMLIVAVNLLTH